LLAASLDGSGERVLAAYKTPESIYPPRIAWSSDGMALAFIHLNPPAVWTIAAERGQAQQMLGPNWRDIVDLAWLPGSRRLVVAGIAHGESAAATKQLYEVSIDGGKSA